MSDEKTAKVGLPESDSINPRNVHSSIGGASSGDFHVYRHERRREQTRITQLEQAAKERDEAIHAYEQAQVCKEKQEQRTEKRRTKRQRRRQNRINKQIEKKNKEKKHV